MLTYRYIVYKLYQHLLIYNIKGEAAMDELEIRKSVRETYSGIVQGKDSSCCTSCGPDVKQFAKSIGYSDEELGVIPDEANLGLSCGNPTALASLKEGEVVLDLGSGAGFDCFLAASKVGSSGRVIGVDMTPAMLEKARENAKNGGFSNVEFRLGEIENLPVADNAVDVVISNCVVNLSADKQKVFAEIYRVLKPGGRVAISDMALVKDLPRKLRESIKAYVSCVAGAIRVEAYEKMVGASGLKETGVTVKLAGACCYTPDTQDPLGKAILASLKEGESIRDYAVSVLVEGYK
jgi:SAM-dependent methyltransferase